MPFAGVGGTSVRGGYTIDNSLRFNDNDSSNLNITPSGAGNRDTFTTSFWIKRGNLGSGQRIWSAGTSIGTNNNNVSSLLFESNDTLKFFGEVGGVASFTLQTNQVFRDVGAWYHIVLAVDTTQSTSSNRVKIYVNGSQITSFSTETYMSQNTDTFYNATNLHTISYSGGGGYVDGYIAEFVHIDGQQLSPTDFGESDLDSGIWKPIEYTGSYGTNGFYLDFENSGSLGADQSGNSNNFTPTNLASTDQTTDTPTNNFATLNPLDTYNSPTLSEGNTKIVRSSSYGVATGTVAIKTGKWYWEIQCPTVTTSGENESFGISKVTTNIIGNNYLGIDTNSWALMIDNAASDIYFNHNNSFTDSGINASNGDIFMFALDADTGKLWFGRNGTWFDSGNPSAGTNQKYTANTDDVYYVAVSMNGNDATLYNFGNPAFSISSGNTDDNGYGNFEYAPPTGFLALCTQNLATALSPTIDDGSQYFNTVLTTGAGAGSYTGVGFQPDFLWFKRRDSSGPHFLIDSTRGSSKYLASESTASETTDATFLTSIDSDGWTGGSGFYGSPATLATWNWKANGGTTSSNTDGSITSTVQANTTAGFSIITYTGTGASATVGHGLTKAPEMVICKQRTDAGTQWQTGHTGLTNWTYKLLLNSTAAESVNANVFPSAPTSTVINLGLAGDSNGSGKSQLIYAFHSVEGYSKFGSYTGNGSTDGTFVYTGFRPAFVIVKRTNSTGYWLMFDSARQPENENDSWLLANDSSNEGINSTGMDFISNGFKLRNSSTAAVHNNISGSTYIYMAFAENPFVTSGGVPVTAR